MAIEKTFSIIKPNAVKKGVIGDIVKHYKDSNYSYVILATKKQSLNNSFLENSSGKYNIARISIRCSPSYTLFIRRERYTIVWITNYI